MYKKRFWNEDVETMSVDDLCNLQRKRLQEAIEWAYEKTSYYRDLFDRKGLKPEDISSTEDLTKAPFTSDIETADDVPLRDRIAVPAEKIRMYHSTSGTVGAVVPIPFTQKDMEAFLQEGEARARWTMGVRPWDVVQVLTRFDCCSLGYRELGSASVLMSAGRYNTDHQIHLTQEAGVTVIEHMPSFLLSYFERMEELGIKVGSTKLRMASGVGEGWAESYKRKVESRFGIPFMTLYGAVEISPFFAAECEVRNGMHINADQGILEVVDPETGKPLPEGEEGEIVVTLFQREAMPLIRYRVGDMGSIMPYEPCPCGRTSPKISYVKGRVSQRINISGRNILPIDVEEIVARFDELENEFRIVCEKPEMDILRLRVEYKDDVKALKDLKEKIEEALFDELGLSSEVDLAPRGSLERVTFKAQRVERLYS